MISFLAWAIASCSVKPTDDIGGILERTKQDKCYAVKITSALEIVYSALYLKTAHGTFS